MKVKNLSFLWLCILASSCYAPPTQITPTNAVANIPVIASPTSQPSSLPSVASSEVSTLAQTSLCPNNREVSLDKLGLLPQVYLVVLPLGNATWGDVNIAYSILSPNSPQPEAITSIAPLLGWTNRNYSISPDGKWILFLRWAINNSTNRELVVSSLDGSKQILVMKLPDVFTHGRWLSDSKLAIIGVTDSSNQDPLTYLYIPLKVIDPFTLEEQPVSALPDEDISRSQIFDFVDNQNYYNLYSLEQSPFEEFVLYDYSNSVSHAVFQWLTGKDDLSFMNTRFYYEDGRFSVVVTRPYGMDVDLNLDLDTIRLPANYENAMDEVELPKEVLPVTVYSWIPSTNSLLLSESQKDIDNPEPLEFYSLDYSQKVLKNYCLQIPTAVDGIFPSPDGHFVAISYEKSSSSKGGITILNLDTGFISTVEEFHMIGWGLK